MEIKHMKNDECNSCNINKYKQHNPACVSCEKKDRL